MALKIQIKVFTALMVFALLPCIVITASAEIKTFEKDRLNKLGNDRLR